MNEIAHSNSSSGKYHLIKTDKKEIMHQPNPICYFVLDNMPGLRPGTLLQSDNDILINMKSEATIPYDSLVTSNCAVISQTKAKYILKMSKRDRLYAFKMIQDNINTYIPISKGKIYGWHALLNFTDVKYYLISHKYRGWKAGSMFSMRKKIK